MKKVIIVFVIISTLGFVYCDDSGDVDLVSENTDEKNEFDTPDIEDDENQDQNKVNSSVQYIDSDSKASQCISKLYTVASQINKILPDDFSITKASENPSVEKVMEKTDIIEVQESKLSQPETEKPDVEFGNTEPYVHATDNGSVTVTGYKKFTIDYKFIEKTVVTVKTASIHLQMVFDNYSCNGVLLSGDLDFDYEVKIEISKNGSGDLEEKNINKLDPQSSKQIITRNINAAISTESLAYRCSLPSPKSEIINVIEDTVTVNALKTVDSEKWETELENENGDCFFMEKNFVQLDLGLEDITPPPAPPAIR